MYNIIAQSLGFIAIALNVLSMQFNKHWQIVLLRTIGSLLFVIHYVMINAIEGAFMDGIGIIRNIVFIYTVQKNKSTTFWIVLFSVLITMLGVGCYVFKFSEWIGILSVLAIIAKLISTIGYGIKNPRIIRLLAFIASCCWLVYNGIHYSLPGVLNEVFVLVSIIIAEIRLYYKNKKNKEKI